MKEFVRGLRAYFKAYKLVSENRLWRFIMIPAVASAAISPFVIWVFYVYFGSFARYVNENWLPASLQSGIMENVITVLFWLVGLLLFLVSIRSIVMVVFSPLLGLLSEKTEFAIRGTDAPRFKVKQLVRDVWRSLILNIIALSAFLFLLIFAWLLVFLPLVGAVVSPMLIIAIESYFAGLTFVDPSLERDRYNVRESFGYAWENRMRMVGLGVGYTALMFIPILGWFLAPPFGVVAATISYLEIEKQG